MLLVRRRDSRHIGWCLPCGWVEYDKEIREALGREMREETGLGIRPGTVFAVHTDFHEPDRQSVRIWFRCLPVLKALDYLEGIESLAPEIPVDPMALLRQSEPPQRVRRPRAPRQQD